MPHVTLTTATQLPEHGVSHHLHNYTLSPSGRTSRQRQKTPGARRGGCRGSAASPTPRVPGEPEQGAGPLPQPPGGTGRRRVPASGEASPPPGEVSERKSAPTSPRPQPTHRVPYEQLRLHRHVPRPERRGTPEPAGAPRHQPPLRGGPPKFRGNARQRSAAGSSGGRGGCAGRFRPRPRAGTARRAGGTARPR